MQKKTATVPAHLDGQRLDLVFVTLMPDLSRKQVKAIIDAGGAYKNRRRVGRAGELVKGGDRIELFWQERQRPGQMPRLGASDCLVLEPTYLVVSKPAGMPSQASLETTAGTVVEAVERDLKLGPVHLVHRLDKETSGLMILARNDATRAHFEEQFRAHAIQKIYLALVAGVPGPLEGRIDAPIAKDGLGANRYRALLGAPKSKGGAQAKTATTDYRVLGVSESSGSAVALVAFWPKTGRTHQIRVHSAQVLGCPVLGDKTYGRQVYGHAMGSGAPVLRHMLHAWRLGFADVADGQWRAVTCPLPNDFLTCLEGCGLSADALGSVDD